MKGLSSLNRAAGMALVILDVPLDITVTCATQTKDNPAISGVIQTVKTPKYNVGQSPAAAITSMSDVHWVWFTLAVRCLKTSLLFIHLVFFSSLTNAGDPHILHKCTE